MFKREPTTEIYRQVVPFTWCHVLNNNPPGVVAGEPEFTSLPWAKRECLDCVEQCAGVEHVPMSSRGGNTASKPTMTYQLYAYRENPAPEISGRGAVLDVVLYLLLQLWRVGYSLNFQQLHYFGAVLADSWKTRRLPCTCTKT